MNRSLIIAIVSIVSVIVLFLVLYFGFSSGDDLKKFRAVPVSSAMVVQFENESSFYDLYKDVPLFRMIAGDDFFLKLEDLKKMFLDNKKINSEFESEKIVLSFQKSKADQVDALFLIHIHHPKKFKKPFLFLSSFLNPKNEWSQYNYEGESVFQVKNTENGTGFAFAEKEGILMLSYSATLVEKALRQLKKNIVDEKLIALLKDRKTSNKGAVADLFINPENLPEFFSAFINPSVSRQLDVIKNFSGWMALEINYKPDAFLLSGVTHADSSGNYYINTLKDQIPQKVELPDYLPQNIAAFFNLGISDYEKFLFSYERSLQKENKFPAWNSRVNILNKKYGIKLDEEVKGITSNEFALAMFENAGDHISDELLSVLKLKDKDKAFNLFRDMFFAEKFISKNEDTIQNYKGYQILPVYISDFFNLFYSSLFSELSSNYMTIIDNYLFAANNAETIRAVIDYYISLQTLGKTKSYLKVSSSISAESNFYFYAGAERSYKMLDYISNEAFRKTLSSQAFPLRKFSGLSVQFSYRESVFLSNVYFPLERPEEKGGSLLWKVELEHPISMKPAIVINHNTQEKEILLQDDENIVYLISNSGKVLWRKKIPSRIISEIAQVDYYKNDKLQFLFNTKEYLYLIDRNGNMMPNYPKRLNVGASTGFLLTDYDGDKNYRVFVPCMNRAIYGYTITGQPLDGWNPKLNVGIVSNPLQYANVGGKDYLFASTDEGYQYFFSRRGEVLIKTDLPRKTTFKNPFVPELSTEFSKCRYLSTDTGGTIHSIFFDGRTLFKHVGVWTNEHFFNYKNVAGDEKPEAIFLDKNQLFIYETDTSLLWNYQFLVDVNSAPQFFYLSPEKYTIGVSSAASNQVFLFKEDGSLFDNFPLKGSGPFQICDLKKTGAINLVTGSTDKSLYVYTLKK